MYTSTIAPPPLMLQYKNNLSRFDPSWRKVTSLRFNGPIYIPFKFYTTKIESTSWNSWFRSFLNSSFPWNGTTSWFCKDWVWDRKVLWWAKEFGQWQPSSHSKSLQIQILSFLWSYQGGPHACGRCQMQWSCFKIHSRKENRVADERFGWAVIINIMVLIRNI